MGKDLWDHDRAVNAQAIMDLFETYPNPQHFQQRALRWAKNKGALTQSEQSQKKTDRRLADERRARTAKAEAVAVAEADRKAAEEAAAAAAAK